MTPERWAKVRDVLGQALELDPEKRSQYLDDACANDPSLRSEVESLLSSDESARSSFLESPPTPPAALIKGTRLGDYEIISLVGAGGMGEVYRARDTKLKRDVAIKVLPAYWSRDPERLERFELEARAAAALNHPNITSIFHVGQHDGSPYMVTELLQGETLRERLRRGPIPLRRAIEYAVQTAHGLAAAHDRGIVHRDLKPENLFVTKDGRVKILDFGLARLGSSKEASGEEATVTQRTDPGVVLGTAGYMSPEQVRGKTVDHRADIFAFGTILYEMVTGKQPFRKSTSAETMTAILNEEPPSISQITPATPLGMQRVVHRCLEKDPEQRFHSSHDLAFALEALSDSGVTSSSGGQAQATPRWTRSRIGVTLAATLIVLVAVVLAYRLTRPEPAPRLSNFVQLTHDGRQKALIGTDGSRLIFVTASPEYSGMAEMSTSGGEPKRLPLLPSSEFTPFTLSHDGSELLASDAQEGGTGTGPLWSLPLLGGGGRRIGDVQATDAAMSLDGKMLAYCNGNQLHVAKTDGSDDRKIATMPSPNFVNFVENPVWSPDGQHLRFDVGAQRSGPAAVDDTTGLSSSIWEISKDGTGIHRLFASGDSPPDVCCGKWSNDRRYFLFRSRGQIWAQPQNRDPFRFETKPVQLTSSPLTLATPQFSADGKRLFVVGRSYRGELMRYDIKSGQFVPFLGGVSGESPTFSKDGDWVAYVSYPEGTLWRSRLDGSDRRQLTFPPGYAYGPHWSPDGKQILYNELGSDGQPKACLISAEGGRCKQVTPSDPNFQVAPNWSPDGTKIVFSGEFNDPETEIRILDLATNEVFPVPGSRGIFAPIWSPDRHYIAAVSFDGSRVMLFDFVNQQWKELEKGIVGWPNWSKDGRYLYYLELGGTGSVRRVNIATSKIEQIANLKNFTTTGRFGISLVLAPDDSPLMLRNAGTQDIYSLDWEER